MIHENVYLANLVRDAARCGLYESMGSDDHKILLKLADQIENSPSNSPVLRENDPRLYLDSSSKKIGHACLTVDGRGQEIKGENVLARLMAVLGSYVNSGRDEITIKIKGRSQ